MTWGIVMPWTESSILDERVCFIADWERADASVAELCRWYGISRKTGHKLIARFEADGAAGLADRSRAPHHHPNAVTEEVVAAVLDVRRRHMSWGPKKIRAWLAAHRARTVWPAESTIGVMLDRHGLAVHRRPRSRAPVGAPLGACTAANEVWGVDFKGWFRTGDGRRCDPLSLSDLHSRYVLRLQVMDGMDAAHVWPVLDAAFREFGLPLR